MGRISWEDSRADILGWALRRKLSQSWLTASRGQQRELWPVQSAFSSHRRSLSSFGPAFPLWSPGRGGSLQLWLLSLQHLKPLACSRNIELPKLKTWITSAKSALSTTLRKVVHKIWLLASVFSDVYQTADANYPYIKYITCHNAQGRAQYE